MLMFHFIINGSKCLSIGLNLVLEKPNSWMFCLGKPQMSKVSRFPFSISIRWIQHFQYLITIINMSHEGVEQFLLCFQQGICLKIATTIAVCWCLINFIIFIEDHFKRLYHTT